MGINHRQYLWINKRPIGEGGKPWVLVQVSCTCVIIGEGGKPWVLVQVSCICVITGEGCKPWVFVQVSCTCVIIGEGGKPWVLVQVSCICVITGEGGKPWVLVQVSCICVITGEGGKPWVLVQVSCTCVITGEGEGGKPWVLVQVSCTSVITGEGCKPWVLVQVSCTCVITGEGFKPWVLVQVSCTCVITGEGGKPWVLVQVSCTCDITGGGCKPWVLVQVSCTCVITGEGGKPWVLVQVSCICVITGEDIRDQWFLQKLKLAVAMTLIRLKPGNMSGEQYAKHVAQQIISQEESWKKKAERYERELLYSRQELVKAKLCGGNDRDPNYLLNGDDNVSGPVSVFPTPPSSLECVQSDCLHEIVSNHSQFLHSIFSLQSKLKDLPMLDVCQVGLTTRDSIIHCVKVMHTSCKELGCQISINKMKFAVDTIVMVMEWDLVDKFYREICQSVIDLVEDILDCIYLNHKIDNANYLEGLSKMVIRLSQDGTLQHSIIKSTMSKVNKCSCKLRSFCQDNEESDWEPCHFGNCYYFIFILEEILTNLTKTKKGLGSLPESLVKDGQQQCEDSLLHVSNIFPLFAHGIWKIMTLFDVGKSGK
ncbi:meiosis-specific protein MEI4-like [Glandiceps talaboti]